MNVLRHAFNAAAASLILAAAQPAVAHTQGQVNATGALNHEMGQLYALGQELRAQENLCQMSGTYTALLDMLRVGLSEEAGKQMDALRARSGLDPEEALALHEQIAQVILESGEHVLYSCAHCDNAEELAPSYQRASLILLRDDIQLSDGKEEALASCEPYIANFANPDQGLMLANQLVDETTGGAVPRVLDELEPNAVAVLAAAARLSGAFRMPFQDALLELSFKNFDGTSCQPKWMRQTHPLPYMQFDFGEGLVCEAVQLPCHGQISLALLRAPSAEETQQVLSALGRQRHWSQVVEWLGQDECFSRLMRLTVPRCKIESGTNYFSTYANEALMQLLQGQDWNGQLFEGTCEEILLTQLVDKHCFELGPKGFFMAGAAAAGFATRSAILQDPIEITLDRPFAFIIWEEVTGSVLGTGVIKQLQDAE